MIERACTSPWHLGARPCAAAADVLRLVSALPDGAEAAIAAAWPAWCSAGAAFYFWRLFRRVPTASAEGRIETDGSIGKASAQRRL